MLELTKEQQSVFERALQNHLKFSMYKLRYATLPEEMLEVAEEIQVTQKVLERLKWKK